MVPVIRLGLHLHQTAVDPDRSDAGLTECFDAAAPDTVFPFNLLRGKLVPDQILGIGKEKDVPDSRLPAVAYGFLPDVFLIPVRNVEAQNGMKRIVRKKFGIHESAVFLCKIF